MRGVLGISIFTLLHIGCASSPNQSVTCITFNLANPTLQCRGNVTSKPINDTQVETYIFSTDKGFSLRNVSESKKKNTVTAFISNVHILDLNFNGFHNLRQVYIENTKIENSTAILPPSIMEMRVANSSLEDFNLGPDSTLKSLDLSDNNLKSVPTARHLRELRLKANDIDTLRTKICAPMTQLSYLDLSDNEITELGKDAFLCVIAKNSTSNLKLILSNNRISSIDERAFEGILIHDIDLSNNQISHLQPNSLDWARVRSINLQHNPFVCMSSLRWMDYSLVQHINSMGKNLIQDLRCEKPLHLQGVQISSWATTVDNEFDEICNCTTTGDEEEEEEGFWNGTTISIVVVCSVAIVLSFIFPQAAESIWDTVSDIVSNLTGD